MYNIDNISKFTELKNSYVYDFSRKSWAVYNDEGNVAAINVNCDEVKEGVPISEVMQKSTGSVVKDMDILQDFQLFRNRPEYKLLHIEIPKNISEFENVYGELLTGAIFLRARYHNIGCNPDEAWPQVEKCLTWLSTTDFFLAPASSRFHDSFAGGLCFHSLRVAQRIVDLMHTATFGDTSRLGDAVFCALIHDWCKIGLYESYNKNVKNEDTGAWEKVVAYRYTGKPLLKLGHGVTSMFLANKFFRLNVEEATAIRWHMGAYRVSDEEFDELQNSNEEFLLVHLLQFADQLALVKY